MNDPRFVLATVAIAGIVGGLVLLARGLLAYRAGERVRGIGTSQVESVAAGEVRLVGIIEPGTITLVSPLQSEPCIYFRARIVEGSGDTRRTAFSEERAVGFRLRDETGTIRVFPRGAAWEAPTCFDESTDLFGDEPPGLRRNAGPTTLAADVDREAAIARLLTVQVPDRASDSEGGGALGLLGFAEGGGGGRREYREQRLAPGDTITIVGGVLPYREIDDPVVADRYDPASGLDDPEVALSIAEARAEGLLRATPEEAWGNAAIPGFGIGRPTRAPDLDPAASQPSIAPAAEAERAAAVFEIPDGELVVAAADGIPLEIRAGTPLQAADRDQGALILGLVGGIGAIVGGVVLALLVEGRLG